MRWIPCSSDARRVARADPCLAVAIAAPSTSPGLDLHVTELIEEARTGAARRAAASRWTAIALGLA